MGATPRQRNLQRFHTYIQTIDIHSNMSILRKKTLNFSWFMGRRRPLIFIVCYGILGLVLMFQWRRARHPSPDTLKASHSLPNLNATVNTTKRTTHSPSSTSHGLPSSLFEGDNKSIVADRVNEYFKESLSNLQREHQSQLLQLTDRREKRLEKFLEKARKEHSDWVQEALSGKTAPDSSWFGFTQTLTAYNQKLVKLERDMSKEGLQSNNLFPPDLSNAVQEMPETRISGFKFCSTLNNAIFNPWVHICMKFEVEHFARYSN